MQGLRFDSGTARLNSSQTIFFACLSLLQKRTYPFFVLSALDAHVYLQALFGIRFREEGITGERARFVWSGSSAEMDCSLAVLASRPNLTAACGN